MDSLKRGFYPDLEQSVQSIVSSEENIPSESLEKIFSDKTKVLKATIKQIFNEINLRLKVDSDIINSVDEDICKCDGYLEQIRDHCQRDYSLQMTLAFMPRRNHLETQVFDLEKQKRQELLECWRDMSFLKKYLMSALSEYWTLSKRQELLASELTEDLENDENNGNL
ncbi:MAG: hypothetical protein AB1393_08225 [Candidatus Edwardsbacteria bacterium]